MKTQMIDKSNFDERQYRADLDSAYECGRASVLSVIEDIKAEIQKPLNEERFFDTDNAKSQAIALNWCLEIIDKYKEDKA